MTETGTILSGMRYVRDVFEQVGVLLQTADAVFEPSGFTVWSSSCFVDTGVVVTKPKHWMPEYAARCYTNDTAPGLFAWVGVLFDDRYCEFQPPLPDCVCTAGIASWGSALPDDLHLYFVKAHGWNPARRYDGSCQDITAVLQDLGRTPPVRALATGRLLRDIETGEHLRTLITPVLEGMRGKGRGC